MSDKIQCSNCKGKYDWKVMINGLCPSCYKASKGIEDPAGFGLGREESEQIDQEDELELDVDEDP